MKNAFLLIVAGLFFQIGFAQQGQGTVAITYKNHPELPAFSLLDLNGNKFSTSSVQQKGKTLVVVYFSPTCSHCIEFTEKLTSQLKSFKNTQFLYVSAYPLEEINTFSATHGFQKMPNFKVGQDPEFNMGRFYELKEIPSAFVYDKSGRLKKSFDSKLQMDDLIESANGG